MKTQKLRGGIFILVFATLLSLFLHVGTTFASCNVSSDNKTYLYTSKGAEFCYPGSGTTVGVRSAECGNASIDAPSGGSAGISVFGCGVDLVGDPFCYCHAYACDSACGAVGGGGLTCTAPETKAYDFGCFAALPYAGYQASDACDATGGCTNPLKPLCGGKEICQCPVTAPGQAILTDPPNAGITGALAVSLHWLPPADWGQACSAQANTYDVYVRGWYLEYKARP